MLSFGSTLSRRPARRSGDRARLDYRRTLERNERMDDQYGHEQCRCDPVQRPTVEMGRVKLEGSES
jgi:hypothetical protein